MNDLNRKLMIIFAAVAIALTVGLFVWWLLDQAEPATSVYLVDTKPWKMGEDFIILTTESYVKRGMAVRMYGNEYSAEPEKAGTTVFEFNGEERMRFAKDGYLVITPPPCKGFCIAGDAWYDFFDALKDWNEKMRKK